MDGGGGGGFAEYFVAINGDEEEEEPTRQRLSSDRGIKSFVNVDDDSASNYEKHSINDHLHHRDSYSGKLFVGGVAWETTEDHSHSVMTSIPLQLMEQQANCGEGLGQSVEYVGHISTLMTLKHYAVSNDGGKRRGKWHCSGGRGVMGGGGCRTWRRIETFSNYFCKYGEITDSVIMLDKLTGRSRGFGFVTFADPAVADKVLEEDHVIDGRVFILRSPFQQVEVKRTVPRADMQMQVKREQKTKKIFVGGIPPSLTEDDLKEYFSSYGSITEHQIMLDHNTGRSRGFGFVTFDDEETVERIFSNGQTHELGGKQVEIKKAVPKRAGSDYGNDVRMHHGGRASKSYGGFSNGAAEYGGGGGGGGGGYNGKMHDGGYGGAYGGHGGGYGSYEGNYGGGAAGFYGGYGGYGYGFGFWGPMYNSGGYGGTGYGTPGGYGAGAGAGAGAGYGGGGKGYGGSGGGKGYGIAGSATGRYHPYQK
ncbi:hypothetical protein TEA_025783 [Camellia sinensis var. sinensis]|uniref:RRM domain-containing protein n=1 Tax=Camellia sinensis var. sinensis TaxID=542762 RepID=A0A4S4ERG0_CAMSN|nr:hypothetical protein TEA_025783 [Camellia sinensis var. sinensis]